MTSESWSRRRASGVGKTVAGIRMIAERARNTLVLVHLRPLLEQWVAQLAMFLDVDHRSSSAVSPFVRRLVVRETAFELTAETEVRIDDDVDRRVPVLARMYERRLTGYRTIGDERSDEAVL